MNRIPTTNYYEILGLSDDCTAQDIKKSYYQLALIWHPDKHDNKKEAELKFTFINEAYTVLNDAAKRALYDSQRQLSLELEETLKEFSNDFDTSIFETQNFAKFDQSPLNILRNILEDGDETYTTKSSKMSKGFNATIRNFIHQEVISSDEDFICSEYKPTFMDKNFASQFTMFNKFYQAEDNSAQYFATIIEDVPTEPTLKRRKSSIIIIGKTEKRSAADNETTKPSCNIFSKGKQALSKLNTGLKRSFIYNEEQDSFEQQPQKKVKRPQVRPKAAYYSEQSESDNEANLPFKSFLKGISIQQDPITNPLSLQDLRKRLQSQN